MTRSRAIRAFAVCAGNGTSEGLRYGPHVYGNDAEARLYDWPGGRLLSTFAQLEAVYDVTCTPDAQWLITASRDRTAQIWDIDSGKPMTPPFDVAGHNMGHHVATSATVTPDGRFVVVTGGSLIRVLDLRELYDPDDWSEDDRCLAAEVLAQWQIRHDGGVTQVAGVLRRRPRWA